MYENKITPLKIRKKTKQKGGRASRLEGDKSNEGMVNIMKVHYMHICNYHSE
jgi:hypothetical protein